MRRTSVVALLLGASFLTVACAPDPGRDHVAMVANAPPAAPAGPTPHVATVTLPAAITSAALLNGSSSIAAGLADGRVAIWTMKGEPVLLKPHATRVLAVGSTKDGAEVWSLGRDGSLARTAVTGAAPSSLRKIDLGSPRVTAASFSPDGSVLATGAEFGEVRVFDTATGTLRHTLRGHRVELQTVNIRHDAALLATASAEADLKVWDIGTGREVSAAALDVSMFALAFSPGNGPLASGGVDRRVTLRDPTTLSASGTIDLPKPMMVASVAWSPDGHRLAIGDLDDATLAKGGLRIVNAETKAVVANLDTGGLPPWELTFVDGGRTLVGAVASDLRAWPVP